MVQKKMVVGDYTDPNTGIRFVEDDRGNYHVIPKDISVDTPQNNPEVITVIVDNNETIEKENKRLKRILESLRSENVWLWEIIELARIDRKKKNASYAMERLDKAIKERQRA
jgi:hypothetical protein